MNEERRPKVGVGVFVQRDDEVLLGLRKGSHGAGTWSIPGGLVEADECVVKTSVRELCEETGISASAESMMTLVAPAVLRKFNKPGGAQSYVTLYAHVIVPKSWQAKLTEPEKCSEWRWISMATAKTWPGSLFECLEDLFKAVRVESPYDLGKWLASARAR